MPRPGAGGDTRERLTDVALRLFAEKGYDNVSVDELVGEAEVTKGAFYHYFRSKDDCLAEIHTDFVNYAEGRFRDITASDESPPVVLRRLVAELIRQVHDFRDEVVLLWDARRRLPEERAGDVERQKADIRHFFTDTIVKGQRQGLFHESHDARVAGLGLFGMCMWAYNWYSPLRERTPQEIADTFADLVIVGLTHSATNGRGSGEPATG